MKIRENLVYIFLIVLIIIIGVVCYIIYINNSNDYDYIRLKGENDRIRESVNSYYLSEEDKESIYKKIDYIDELIANKEDKIEISNSITDVSRELFYIEKENVNELFSSKSQNLMQAE